MSYKCYYSAKDCDSCGSCRKKNYCEDCGSEDELIETEYGFLCGSCFKKYMEED